MYSSIWKNLKDTSARGKTAALFIDFQNQFFSQEDRPVFENAGVLANDLRDVGIEAIWVVYSHLNRPLTRQSLSVYDFQRTLHGKSEGLSPLVKARPHETVIVKDKPQAFESRGFGVDKIPMPSALSIHLDTLGTETLLVSGVMARGCVAATIRAGILKDQFSIIAVADCINIPPSENYRDYYQALSALSEDPALMRSQFAIARSGQILPHIRPPKGRPSQAEPNDRLEPFLSPSPLSAARLVA